ncbi:MAG: glycosyltransferase family 4 protein [Planctomycetaceae bacterium]|nr:glycosyltransferase family 4 protein [Planctomycetaceae bacterium]
MDSQVYVVPSFSNGVLRRLNIAFSTWKHQGEINHITGDITFAALAAKPSRTVLTILDCGDLAQRRDWKATVLRKLWVEWPARHVARITTISEATKSDIIKLTGCPADRIDVIPVAISTAFRRLQRLPQFECPRILQVGTSVNKNLSRLIAALRDLRCTLVIVGKLNEQIQRELADSGVAFENHVNLTEESLILEYEKSDIVAFASTYEGFGMPIVEAQTVGRPVVTSSISSMPEVAGDGACLVDPFDVQSIRAGFDRIVSDPGYASELIERGFRNAERFDPEAIAAQYLRLYESISAELRVKKAV